MDFNKLMIDLRKSKALRTILAPCILLKKRQEEADYSKLEDKQILQQYKDIHKGKRCFVIGNGPSLTIEDLEKLKGEITFGTNGIFYSFDKTTWRPTYYMSMDNSFLDTEFKNIKEKVNQRKFLNYYCSKFGRGTDDDIIYILIKGPYKVDRSKFYQKDISEDVSEYFAQTFSITTTCIEFAIYMGFKEIYLIGVDNNYTTALNDNKANESVHFYKTSYNQKGIVHYADNQIKSYELYRDFAKSHGVSIYNATRGGRLEVYPRVNLDEILEEEE